MRQHSPKDVSLKSFMEFSCSNLKGIGIEGGRKELDRRAQVNVLRHFRLLRAFGHGN